LGAALAISIAMHLALVAALRFGGWDAGVAAPTPSGPLEVTLSSAAEPVAIAMPPATATAPPASETTLPAPTSTGPARAANQLARPLQTAAAPLQSGSPLPSRPAPTEFRGTDEGRVSINVADPSEPADTALLAPLLSLYPRAERIVPEFANPPTAAYPVAALAERRQQQLRVPIVVRDDGRVDLPQGMLDDPVFGPSVHAALAGAQAVPPRVDGRPATGWALLVFSFEFVGAR
jgi:hypothetical protein